MRWSKIKNMILLLLAMVNLFLLGIVGSRLWHTERGDWELRTRMLTVLERNNIAFLPEEIPGDMPLTARQVTLHRMDQEQAAGLVGTVTETTVSDEGALTCKGTQGSVTFYPDGALDARFQPGACPVEDGRLAEAGAALLSELGLEVREVNRERESVTYLQLWEGSPIPQVTLTLTCQDGALDRLTGRAIVGTETPLTVSDGYLSASTALARFLGDLQKQVYVCSQITKLYPGYAVSGAGVVKLTPTWYLETDTAWRCAIDGVTGLVTAEEPVW